MKNAEHDLPQFLDDKARHSAMQRDLGELARGENDASDTKSIHLYYIRQPLTAAIIDTKDDTDEWQGYAIWVGDALGNGAAGWIGSQVLQRLLNSETTTDLSKKALHDVARIVSASIEAAFVTHYVEQISYVNEQLLRFRDRVDRTALERADDRAEDLMSHIIPRGIGLLGSFVMLANLQLTALLNLAEIDTTMRATYSRKQQQYKSHAIDLATADRDWRSAFFLSSSCYLRSTCHQGDCHWNWEFTWDRSRRRESGSNNVSQESAREQCEAKLIALQSSERDQPIQRVLNPIIAVASAW